MKESKHCFIVLILLITVSVDQSQTFQSVLTLQGGRTDFIPANPIELIATYTDISTVIACFNKCNMNPLCRTFVVDTTLPFVCRLYQGAIDTGTIVASTSSTSQVASLHYDASLYGTYNHICDPKVPPFDRYLICTNRSWHCPAATYWNGSMCINQVYYEGSCKSNKVCRQDIGLICLLTCSRCLCNSTFVWNSTSCVPSTCPNVLPTDSSLLSLWLLDNDAHDSMNNYNGTVIGSPSFATGYVNQGMVFAANGYIMLPHIDFYRRSFTLEMWFYLTNITYNSTALFGECPPLPVFAQCLHIGTDNIQTTGMGFYGDDAGGTTVLVSNQWYHVAFIYDYDHRQRLIYLNGIPETIVLTDSTAPHLYLGQTGNATIGGIPIFTGNFFIGYIDHVSITYRVKTANEILNDASLVAYYSFDCGSILDSGPNLLHGSATGYTTILGRINGAIQFNSSAAYFQASGFTALGTSNQSFSVAVWIKPITVSGTLVHLSSKPTGNGSCTTILGFGISGNIIARIPNLDVYGPIPTLNAWTHIIHTFSVINGIRLYINGNLYASSESNIARNSPNVPLYLTLGNQLFGVGSCNSSIISNTSYAGAIDELRVLNREISASEACMLSS